MGIRIYYKIELMCYTPQNGSDEPDSYFSNILFQLFRLIKFTITLTIVSFSSALLSAINKVKATRALSARLLLPSSFSSSKCRAFW